MLVGEVFARMGLDSKEYERSLDRLENVTKKRALTLGNILKNALSVTIGMSMFEAVKRGFQTVVGESISFNAQMEQARIGFTTMLGSAERAQVFLDDMAKFAAKTPFEFPELLDASKRMLAYGFAAEDVLPTMEAVGNATAALGLGAQGIDRIILALGQMRAKGKLSGEEMRQLTEAGIPAWEMLAEAMGKTTAEIMDMQSKGLIPADRAIKMLVEGMNKRFPDMMKNMENTWEGVTSTIKDVWRMTIGAVTQNLFQGVVSWLQKVRDFAVGFYDTFQKYGLQRAIYESFGPEVAALVSVLSAVLRGLASVVKAVTGFFMQYGKQIKFVTIVMGTYLALTKAVTLAKQMMITITAVERGQLLAKIPVLNVVSAAMGIYRVQMALAAAQGIVLTGVIAKLRVALYSLWSALGPIGWAILGLSVAVGVGMNIWNKYKSALEQAKLQDSLAAIEEQTKKLGQSSEDAAAGTDVLTEATQKAGEAAGKNLQSFDEVHQLQEDMAGSAEDLAKSMGLDVPEVEGLEDLFDVATPDLSEIQVSWQEVLSAIWDDVKGWAGNLWEGVKNLGGRFVEWVKGWSLWEWIGKGWEWVKGWSLWEWIGKGWESFITWAGSLWEGIKEKWNGFKTWAGEVFGPLWDGIKEKWAGFKEWAGNLWDGVKEKWNGFKTWAGEVFGPLWDGIKEKWGGFKKFATDMWDGAKEKWTGFKDFAGNTWDGIKTTIQEKWNTLKTEAPLVWDNIKTTVSTSWNTLKTEAPIVWGNIKDSISTKWDELKTNAPVVWDNIKTTISTKWDELKTNAPIVWGNIKTTISTSWDELKTNAPTTWENIKKGISERWEELRTSAPSTWEEIKKNISDRWEALKEDTPKTWDEIAGKLADIWDGIKTSASEKWEGVKTVIKGAVNGIIGFINKFIKAWNKIELKVPEVKIPLVGTVGGWSVRVPQIPEIPMLAKGGLVMDPTLAMLGEAGPEAVVPLGRSGFAEDLADTVARAVYQAIMDAIRISRASSPQSSDEKEIVLKIDNAVLARMQLPALTREAERQGFDLVLRPQGV